MSQFIIATNNATVWQRNAITNHIKSKGWSWWHHFEDFWMVTTNQFDYITSEQLWTELSAIPVVGKATYMVVIKLQEGNQPMTHFGFGPEKGWDWTKKNWGEVG